MDHLFSTVLATAPARGTHFHDNQNVTMEKSVSISSSGRGEYRTYRILPNKGTGRASKIRSDFLRLKLKFWAFQRWFRIENWTICKKYMSNMVSLDIFGIPQTMGAPLLQGHAY